MLTGLFRGSVPTERPFIRTYPWPYRAAFAFSNDCDYLSIEAAVALHRFLAAPIDAGGAGLEVSDSFFFYNWDPSDLPTFSYFKGLSRQCERCAPVVRELVRTGYLDTIHTWGNFRGGGFQRRRAEWALNELQKHGLTIPIWTNHGGGNNVQGIGERDDYTYHQGDDLASFHYHLDLLDRLGVRYYALSRDRTWNFVSNPGGDVVRERARKAPTWILRTPFLRFQDRKYRGSNFEKREIFARSITRAGNCLQSFNRYDGFLENGGDFPQKAALRTRRGVRAGPNLGRISRVLDAARLDALADAGGCCVMYQHFSTIRFEPDRRVLTAGLEIHPDNVAALRLLAGYHARGTIWVAAQAILLDYLYMRNTVTVGVRASADQTTRIHVAPGRGYAARNYAGLSVAVPAATRRAVFVLPGGVEQEGLLVGPEEGSHFAMLATPRLPPIDWTVLARESGIDLREDPAPTWEPDWGGIGL